MSEYTLLLVFDPISDAAAFDATTYVLLCPSQH